MVKFIHIALILLLATHGWAAGAVTYACRMSGEISSKCCCSTADVSSCDVVRAARSCCDVTVSHAVATPAASRPVTSGPQDNHHPAWSASISFAALLLPRMPEGFATAKARHESASPPPLILITQSIRC